MFSSMCRGVAGVNAHLSLEGDLFLIGDWNGDLGLVGDMTERPSNPGG